ncbi:hypothetical protein [Rhodovulum sulfidophilum]|uniref:hypothetical protein n=1 Tax=Rhodovulum sulfidophilum TaxID=35806 RepID=UPI000952218E|nr:hypothetical protein [Rhodovulum sulfidophilum]OLS42609.1 hypothetical protein BV379_19585 [Rhodovulum sulfidophilum]
MPELHLGATRPVSEFEQDDPADPMNDPSRAPSFPSSSAPDPTRTRRRFATAEERSYLRRFNRLRRLRRLIFATTFVWPGLAIGVLAWIGIEARALDGYVVSALVFLALCVLVGVFVFSGWGAALVGVLRMRPALRVPDDLQVEVSGDSLRTIVHPTRDSTNIFTLRRSRDLVEIPFHWERDLVADGLLPGHDQHIEVARLPDASGEVLRLPMSPRHGRARIDPTLPDLGVFLLRLGDRSIAREMRAGLPLLRAQDTILRLGFGAGLLGLLACLVCWIAVDDRLDEMAGLRSTVTRIVGTYGAGAEIPAEALAARGLDDLRPDPEFGNRLLHAGPVSFRTVSLSPDADPFLMSDEEIVAVNRIGRVFPFKLVGVASAEPALIADYRDQLMKRARSLSAVMPDLPDRITALSDTLIASQLRAMSFGSPPDSDFVEAVLPRPTIRTPRRSSFLISVEPSCLMQDFLCGQRDPAEAYENPVFISGPRGIVLRDGADLDRLAEARDRLREMDAETWPSIATAVCAISVLLPVFCILAWVEANRRIRRWYRSGGPVR